MNLLSCILSADFIPKKKNENPDKSNNIIRLCLLYSNPYKEKLIFSATKQRRQTWIEFFIRRLANKFLFSASCHNLITKKYIID